MEQDLYIKILEHLYVKSGINIKIDITLFLNVYFKNEPGIETYFQLNSQEIKKYLDPMVKSGHIEYQAKPVKKDGAAHESIDVIASITENGLKFLFAYQLHEITKNNNEISKRSLKVTKISFKITLILSCLTLILTSLNFYFQNKIKIKIDTETVVVLPQWLLYLLPLLGIMSFWLFTSYLEKRVAKKNKQ